MKSLVQFLGAAVSLFGWSTIAIGLVSVVGMFLLLAFALLKGARW